MQYTFLLDALPWTSFAAPLAAAEDALARLDERLRTSQIRNGFIARTHFSDACACLWTAGELVHLEDLVLHDAGMDVRTPTHELTRAHTVLRLRRTIAAAAPGWALSTAGLASLTGQGRAGDAAASGPAQTADHRQGFGARDGEVRDGEQEGRQPRASKAAPEQTGDDDDLSDMFASIDAAISSAENALAGAPRQTPPKPARDPLIHDPDHDEEARLSEWQSLINKTRALPPLLAAATALEAWDNLQPLQHRPWLGRLLAASLLRQRDKTRHHLPCLFIGLKALTPAQRRQAGHGGLALHLAAITSAAETGLKDHDRWLTAHTLLTRKLSTRRSTSNLPALVKMAMESPILSTAMVAAQLKISPRAAQNLIAELGLRELTGRGRYRAWGIV